VKKEEQSAVKTELEIEDACFVPENRSVLSPKRQANKISVSKTLAALTIKSDSELMERARKSYHLKLAARVARLEERAARWQEKFEHIKAEFHPREEAGNGSSHAVRSAKPELEVEQDNIFSPKRLANVISELKTIAERPTMDSVEGLGRTRKVDLDTTPAVWTFEERFAHWRKM